MKEYPPELVCPVDHPSFDEITHAGSTAILGAGADVDFYVLTHDLETSHSWVLSEGWIDSGNGYAEDFRSVRKGEVNLILFADERMYYERVAAMRIARWLHAGGLLGMSDKELRVSMHQVASGELD